MTNTRFDAMKKIVTLAEALEACGVHGSTIHVNAADGYVSIRIDSWNCIDGSKIPITFALMEDDDYTGMKVIAEPENEITDFFKKLLS